MKMTRFLTAVVLLTIVAAVAGCGGGSGGGSTSESYFIVNPVYGAPGATETDTETSLSGSVYSGAGCEGQSDCNESFTDQYATISTSNPSLDGYTFPTNAVGGVDWDFTGQGSPNCSAGYSDNEVSVGAETTIPIMCQSPTTDFTASPAYWVSGTTSPSSIAFTAVSNTFPTSQYAAATTVYSTAEAVQWQGSVTSASAKQITVPVSNTTVGTHVVIFRNSTTNAVIGAGAYVVVAPATCPLVSKPGNATPLARPTCP